MGIIEAFFSFLGTALAALVAGFLALSAFRRNLGLLRPRLTLSKSPRIARLVDSCPALHRPLRPPLLLQTSLAQLIAYLLKRNLVPEARWTRETLTTEDGGEIALEEVLSNPVFFSLFKRFLTEEKLVDSQLLYFMAELNEYLEMPANDHLLKFARKIAQKYLHGATPIHTPPGVVADIDALLASDTLPPRDIFTPVLNEVYGTLSKSAYRLFQQSTAFQPLLELKAKSAEVPKVQGFKMLQILGEGYEGKVLQVRKKDCGCMYALKVLDKVVLASRSRRWYISFMVLGA